MKFEKHNVKATLSVTDLGNRSFQGSVFCEISHLDAAWRMKSRESIQTHDELLIREPSGDANNLLLIHQGHHLRTRQHCIAEGNITQCSKRQWKTHDLLFFFFFQTWVFQCPPTPAEEFVTVQLSRSSLTHDDWLIRLCLSRWNESKCCQWNEDKRW